MLIGNNYSVETTLEEIGPLESVLAQGSAGAKEERSSKVMPRTKTARKDLSKGGIRLIFKKVQHMSSRNASRSRVATSDQ